jgi:hypothetical protein
MYIYICLWLYIYNDSYYILSWYIYIYTLSNNMRITHLYTSKHTHTYIHTYVHICTHVNDITPLNKHHFLPFICCQVEKSTSTISKQRSQRSNTGSAPVAPAVVAPVSSIISADYDKAEVFSAELWAVNPSHVDGLVNRLVIQASNMVSNHQTWEFYCDLIDWGRFMTLSWSSIENYFRELLTYQRIQHSTGAQRWGET